jgi:hypothetical protein
MDDHINRFENNVQARLDSMCDRIDRFEEKVNRKLILIEEQIIAIKIELREVKSELSAMNRRFDDVRKDMIVQTRWTIAIVTLLTVVVKLVDIFVK